MKFCAVCTSERGPFEMAPLGKDDAMVSVCSECNDTTPVAYDSPRGYEPSGGLPTIAQATAAAKRVLGDKYEHEFGGDDRFSPPRYEVPAGWRLFRVHRRKPNGQPRDSREAYETLRGQPWFGPGRVKYAGNTNDFILFAYAPTQAVTSNVDPIAELEQFRRKV